VPVGQASLACHPATRSRAVRSIDARIARTGSSLEVAYAIAGDIARLRVPPPRPPCIAAQLWQHTCCELFVAAMGPGEAYHEFNFSPSGEWAARAFTRYRDGVLLEDERLAPRIAVRADGERLELEAAVTLERLPYQGRLRLGLSAVLEEEDGTLSYWALRHPAGSPDFHHADAFAFLVDRDADAVRD
jgi:hypothetical protein